jgi:hypothetical protein
VFADPLHALRGLLAVVAVRVLRAVDDTDAVAPMAAAVPTVTVTSPCGDQDVPVTGISVAGTPGLTMVASWDCPGCGRHSARITPPTAAELVADGARWVKCPAEAVEGRPGGGPLTEGDAEAFAFDLDGVRWVSAIAAVGGTGGQR